MFKEGQEIIVIGMEDGNGPKDVPAIYKKESNRKGMHIVYIDSLMFELPLSKLKDSQEYWDAININDSSPSYIDGMTIGEAVKKRKGIED